MSWAIAIDEMRGVMRIVETVELTRVPQKDKQLDGTTQGLEATGKAAGFAS